MRSLAFGCALVVVLGGCPSAGGPAAEGEGEGEPAAEGEGEAAAEGEGEAAGEGEGEAAGEGEGEAAAEGEGEAVVQGCGDGVVAGCVADGDDFACTLQHDGQERRYVLHVPATYAARPATGAPLVLAFHGIHTTAAIQQFLSGMNDDSEVNGYVVAYPEGVGAATNQSFNAGTCCGDASADGVDDVGFALAIIDQVAGTLCVDDDRVYATGLSNGGHMAYRLACEEADVFAAVASVAGVETTPGCAPSRPIALLHFHGDADPIVNYDLGIDGVHGAERSVDDFAGHDGCAATSTTTLSQGEVSCVARDGCAAGSAVELCTVHGGGHQWPGGNDLPLLGHNTDDVDATARIWSFFAAHPRP
jgi:polyhydroxybutyrate depolymerase